MEIKSSEDKLQLHEPFKSPDSSRSGILQCGTQRYLLPHLCAFLVAASVIPCLARWRPYLSWHFSCESRVAPVACLCRLTHLVQDMGTVMPCNGKQGLGRHKHWIPLAAFLATMALPEVWPELNDWLVGIPQVIEISVHELLQKVASKSSPKLAERLNGY